MPPRLRKPVLAPDAHLRPGRNGVGLKQMPVIAGAVNRGGDVEVHEASGPHPAIWLQASADGKNAMVQLDLIGARRLAEQIIYLVEHHHTKENR